MYRIVFVINFLAPRRWRRDVGESLIWSAVAERSGDTAFLLCARSAQHTDEVWDEACDQV